MANPYLIGSFSAAAGGTLTPTVSVTNASNNGDCINVGVLCTAGSVTALNDSQGNTYVLVQSETVTAGCQVYHFQSVGTTLLTNGVDTLTPTYSSSSSVQGVIAVGDPGVSGADIVVGATATSGTTASVSTGTLDQAEEHVLAFLVDLNAGGTPTLGGGLTSLGTVTGGTVAKLTAGYHVVSSTAATTPSGTITSTTWAISVCTNAVNPVSITTTPPAGLQGVAYSWTLTATGGVSPYSYSVTSGALPSGLSIVSGVVTGTPTVNGSFAFTITASDANGVTGSQLFSMNIIPSGPSGIPATTIPANLLKAADSDFESGSTTWASFLNTNTPTNSTAISFTGSKSLTYTCSGTTSKIISGTYTVKPNQPYLFQAMLMTARNADCFVQFNWETSGGTFISSQESSDIQSIGGQWQPLPWRGYSPSNAGKVTIVVETDNVMSGDVHFMDFAHLINSQVQVVVDWVYSAFGLGEFAGAAFMDVSPWVRDDQQISMNHGRQDAISEIQAGAAQLQLQNDTGLFSASGTENVALPLGGSLQLQSRLQANVVDETGTWWTRFDGPISEIDYLGDNTGNTNVATISAADVLAYMNRQDNLLCWTRCQIADNGPLWHWALDDSGQAFGNSLAAESSGNGGPPMRTHSSDSTNTATIAWADTTGGIETLANAVTPENPDGSEYWTAGTNQPTSATRGLDSGAVGPFTSPSPSIYLVPKVTASSARNNFASNNGYTLNTTLPVPLTTGTSGDNFACEFWFTCDPSILASPSALTGPYVQFSLANSKTQRNLLAGIFLTGTTNMQYQVDLYDQSPPFAALNFSGASVASATSSVNQTFVPDAVQIPHHVVLNFTGGSPGTVDAYLDTNHIGQLTLHNQQNFDTVIVGGAWGGQGCHAGGIQLVTIYPYALNTSQIAQDCMLGQYGMWEQTTDDTIALLADLVDVPNFWNNLNAQSNGLALTDYMDITGSNGLSSMQLFEQTEMGLLYVNSAGQLSFYTRDWRMGHPAPVQTLPPDTYDANMGMELVDQFQCNEQAVSSQAFPTGAAFVNVASQEEYGAYAANQVGSPVQLPIISWNRAFGKLGISGYWYWPDPNMQDFCAWSANSRSEPWLVPGSLSIDMLTVASSKLKLSQMYALDVGSLIAPTGTLPASFPNQNLSTEWFIEGINETISNVTHSFQIFCSAAETQRAWKAGDSTYGVLGVTTQVGVSEADTSVPQADGKDVSHDAGRPYWPPTFAAEMNNPANNGHGFVGATDLRGLTDNLDLVLNPPMLHVSTANNQQSIPTGSSTTPELFWDTVHVDTVGGLGLIPGWPNWYVCLVPGFYEIDAVVPSTNSGTSGNAWQSWIVVALGAAQAVQAGTATPLTVAQYVCPIGETTRVNNSGSINTVSSPTTRMYLGLGDMVALATEASLAQQTGLGAGGLAMSLIFKGYGKVDDRININSSIATGGTVTQPSTGVLTSTTFHSYATYSYYGQSATAHTPYSRRNTNGNVYQACANGGERTTGSQFAQISYKNQNINALAGHTIKSASLRCTNIYSGNGVFCNLLLGVYYDISGQNIWKISDNSLNDPNIIQQDVGYAQVLTFSIPTSIITDLATGANGLIIGNNSTSQLQNYGYFVGGPGTWILSVEYI